jgi:hypothetical protein
VLSTVFLLVGCAEPKMYQGFACQMPDRTVQYEIHQTDLGGGKYDLWAIDTERRTQDIVLTDALWRVTETIETALPMDCRVLGGRIVLNNKLSEVKE